MIPNLGYHQGICRLCKKSHLTKILKLKPTPAGNNFLTFEEKLSKEELIFPLELFFCEDCFHIQLGYAVDPKHLFNNNYHFVSGTSPVNVSHFSTYADEVISKFKLKKNSFILDIGSNDGTCLQAFKERGMRVLGIDPAKNIAEIANKNNIETIAAFFSNDLAVEIREHYGPPDLVTSHNVLAHIEDFSGIINAIVTVMNKDTILAFEVGYFRDVFKNLWFDTIYHEHLDYHTITPLIQFFKSIGMQLFHVEKVDIQGGSIRNFVQLCTGKNRVTSSIKNLMKLEKKEGLTNSNSLKDFQSRIDIAKENLLDLIKNLKNSGKTIVGYGAPTKSTTLMNYFDLDASLIDYIIDDNPLKQNKYSPLLHIPIFSSEKLKEKPQPDFILILAWNFAESIINKVRNRGDFSGGFIIPLPEANLLQD